MGNAYTSINSTERLSCDHSNQTLRDSIDNNATEKGPYSGNHQDQQMPKSRNGIVALVTLLFVSATIVLITIARGINQSKDSHPWQHSCGSTVTEAIAMGCGFDLLSYSWTPSPCLDMQTSNEFLEWLQKDKRVQGSFPFFADYNGTKRLRDVDELAQLAGSIAWSTQEEHLGHCIFWMRRMERVRLGLARQLMRGIGVQHAMHCTMSLLEDLEGHNKSVVAQPHAVLDVGFNQC